MSMWKIEQNVSIGPLRLGMTQTEFSAELGKANTIYERYLVEFERVFVYETRCVTITCDENNIVKRITVLRPNKVTLVSIQLIGRSMTDVCSDLNIKGFVTEHTDVGDHVTNTGVFLVDYEGFVSGVELRLISE